jgi:type III restriction enzyme
LRRTLINFAEYYLSIIEFEARELFLFPQNRELLIQHVTRALESFERWQKELGNKHKRSEDIPWEVPSIRFYNENFNEESADNHALKPFYEYEKASNPEVTFQNLLEEKDQNLEWWYKNGDAGKEHFAVSYIDTEGVLRSFFVDFILKFKSGKIGLFDTKTKRSDSNAPNKHNALLNYIEEENSEETKFLGGVIIPEITNNQTLFRFCRNKIENTSDLTGWDYFNPDQY